jgi:HprK-related kinase B
MSGVPKLPRINPGTILSIPELAVHFVNDTINRYKDLTPEQLWHLEEKYDAFIDDIYGSNRFIIKTDLHALVLLTWKREPGETAMKQVDLNERPDLMPAFMKSPGLFYLTDAEGALRARDRRNYLDLLNKVPVYEISGGVNFDLATQFCLDIVGNVSESAIK